MTDRSELTDYAMASIAKEKLPNVVVAVDRCVACRESGEDGLRLLSDSFRFGVNSMLKYKTKKINKVITTMVIRPLDDRTYCVQSAFTHLGLWQKPV